MVLAASIIKHKHFWQRNLKSGRTNYVALLWLISFIDYATLTCLLCTYLHYNIKDFLMASLFTGIPNSVSESNKKKWENIYLKKIENNSFTEFSRLEIIFVPLKWHWLISIIGIKKCYKFMHKHIYVKKNRFFILFRIYENLSFYFKLSVRSFI